jgi:hypothetical protein
LVTVAIALDLGPGVVRTLFEGQVQLGVLSAGERIRDFVEEHWLPDRNVARAATGASSKSDLCDQALIETFDDRPD